MGFVRLHGVAAAPRSAIAPQLHEPTDHRMDRLGVVLTWAEIPGFSEFRSFLPKSLREPQVAFQRFEHQLPGAHRQRIADFEDFARETRTDRVRHQSICGPIAAAYDIASLSADAKAICDCPAAEVRFAICFGDQFRTSFAIAVRIATA